MPELPTPPKPMWLLARWMTTSLTVAPPNGSSRMTRCCTALSSLNTYVASGFSNVRTMANASSSVLYVMTGSTGPKISSFITGSSSVTPRRHVGSMRSVPASPRPPNATVASGLRCSISPITRSKWRWLIMCGHSSHARMSSP